MRIITNSLNFVPGQNAFVLWFTGLPCSGKTTLSNQVKKELSFYGLNLEQLDGDIVRQRKDPSLGYSKEDRMANVVDVVSQAFYFIQNGIITLVSLISPYRMMREYARQRIGPFIEIYVRCPLEVCESRDIKGMYRLAREGKINHFTGISDPYEEPVCPELILETDVLTIEESARKVMMYLKDRELIPSRPLLKNVRDINN